MPSLKTFRLRIRSVQSTQKITKAMKMVAAAKLRRAQEQAMAARPYAEAMDKVLAALAQSSRARFDIALLDLDLPGMDGLALARQLRIQGFTAPLLAVTARADADAEPLARAAGFNGFVRKPITGQMLADAIQALFDATVREPVAS